ncbi:MAG TPA: DUF2111 domain-containing protein [Methanothrix sp.]|nr:DUF2111 domain-containing protein [Methanothrix sp.]HQJ80641.1 DUF2111 domain-containing protein [Methanothrix sp.]
MPGIVISEDARPADLAPLALALNEIIRLPVTIRSRSHPGVRVEKGDVVDDSYSGPVLEAVISTGKSIRTTPDKGAYRGIPVSVAPIVVDGQTVAAVGIVDVIGTIDIPEVFGAYGDVIKQVQQQSPVRK